MAKRRKPGEPRKREIIAPEDYLSGFNELMENLNSQIQKMETQSIRGAKAGLSRIMAKAKQRAPLDKGDLRRSGIIKDPVMHDDEAIIEFGFYAPYAADQHEHTEYDHPKGGEAKYLENAIIDNRERLLQLIAGEMMK